MEYFPNSPHHPVPGKPYQHQKSNKKQNELIEWHKCEYKNVGFLQYPHHRYKYSDDKNQAANLVKTGDIAQAHVLLNQPQCDQHTDDGQYLREKIGLHHGLSFK